MLCTVLDIIESVNEYEDGDCAV